MKLYSIITFILFFFFSTGIWAQEKLEKEYRLNIIQVPKGALGYVDALGFNKKVKWYAERSLEGKTIEAKAKANNTKFSIEFTSEGVIEDIEQTVAFNKIAEPAKQNIITYLQANYTRYGVRKTQIQYPAITQENAILVVNGTPPNIPLNYEIIIVAKDKNVKLYEFLFSKEGEFIKKANIVFKTANHLEF